jgi:hypothetical protein
MNWFLTQRFRTANRIRVSASSSLPNNGVALRPSSLYAESHLSRQQHQQNARVDLGAHVGVGTAPSFVHDKLGVQQTHERIEAKMAHSHIWLTCVVASALAQNPTRPATLPRTPPPPKQPLRETTDPRAEIAALREKITELEGLVWDNYLEFLNKVSALEKASATFDPASPGAYQRVNTSVGPLLLSLTTVEPYLDGYRISLEAGNPLLINFKGFTLSAKWGPRFKKDETEYREWVKALRTKDFEFPNSILPGKWNLIQLIVPDTKPSAFGHLEIALKINTLSLVEPPR